MIHLTMAQLVLFFDLHEQGEAEDYTREYRPKEGHLLIVNPDSNGGDIIESLHFDEEDLFDLDAEPTQIHLQNVSVYADVTEEEFFDVAVYRQAY